MADDVNNSNKPINGLSEIESKRTERHGQDTATTSDLREQAKKREEAFQQAESDYIKQRTKINESKAEAAAAALGQVRENIKVWDVEHTRIVNNEAAREISTHTRYDNVNARTTTMSSSQKYLTEIYRDKNILKDPTGAIEQRIKNKQFEIGSIGSELAQGTRDAGTGDLPLDMVNRTKQIESLQESVALDKRLLKVQNKEGMTTEKRQFSAQEILAHAERTIGGQEIKKRIQSGDHKGYEAESAEFVKMVSTLNNTFKEFQKATEDVTNGIAGSAEKYKEASDALEDAKKNVANQDKLVTGIGGIGGGGGWIGRNANPIAMYAQAAGAIAGGFKTAWVDQDITQMNNRAAFANMGNQIFDKSKKAVRGYDVDAMLDIAGSDAFAQQYGMNHKTIANVAGGIEAGANLVANVATGAAGGVLGGGAGIAAGVATGAANSIPAVTNVVYGNVGADAAIRSYQAAKNLTAEERHIRASNMQEFYTQGLTTYQTTMGMGSVSDMQKDLMDEKTLGGLAGAGVSPAYAAQLAGALGQAGAMSGTAGVSILTGAGKAGQRGQMGREEYVGAAASLIGAGGNENDLESIIANATTKGMDNSKNIGQMVSATLMMSSDLGKIGVSGTSAISGMLSAGTQHLVGLGVNKNLATDMVASGVSNMNRQMSNQDMTLGNLMERQSNMSLPGGKEINVFQRNKLNSLNMSDFAVLKAAEGGGKDETAAAKDLLRRRGGLDEEGLFFKNGKIQPEVTNAVLKRSIHATLMDIGAYEQAPGMMNSLDTKGKLDSKQMGVLGALGIDEGTWSIFQGKTATGTISNKMGMGADAEITAAEQPIKAIGAGKKSAEEIGPKGSDGFQNIQNLAKQISQAVDPGKWSEVVVKASKDFSIPATKLTEQMEALVKVQTKMLAKMDEKRGPNIPSTQKQ